MGIKSSMMGGYGLDSSGSSQEPAMGSCEHGNEPLSAIKCMEFIKQMRNWEGDYE
jgi:hypothetical protein